MIRWLKHLWCDNRHTWFTITWTITKSPRVKQVYEIAVCWNCGRQFKNGVERTTNDGTGWNLK